MNIEKYVVTTTWNISRFGANLTRGQILNFDPEKGTMEVNGKIFQDASREVEAGKKIISPSTKTAILVPYTDKIAKNVISDIEKRLKANSSKVEAPKMVVINSDADLIDVINLGIKNVDLPARAKLPELDQKLEVIEENNVVKTLTGIEELQEQVENLQKPIKMKVVAADESGAGNVAGKPLVNAGLKIRSVALKNPAVSKKGKK
ncbi:MAG: hypothetical protein M0P12_00805 [Paludibacteraceae bacterium]|nr:hypothetical protein [Paludibacteraceae bacterium]